MALNHGLRTVKTPISAPKTMALKTRAVTKESVLAALALDMSVVSVEVDADGAADVVVVDIVARNHSSREFAVRRSVGCCRR